MAIDIRGTTICLTRGDTLKVAVALKDSTGADYSPATGDSVRFAMRPVGLTPNGKAWKNDVVLTKSIPTGTMLLQIDPEDTAELPFGCYAYDIQVTFADGTVDTAIADATLVLTPEVA